MKYYIIAGEASGDLHGANLMKEILKKDTHADFRYWGGDHMADVADGQITHIKETSIMGFVEVAKNISKIKSFFKKAKNTILEFQPDKIIYIDYPGFNLRMAEWSKKQGYHNTFYISPQLWAWKKGRVKKVKAYIDDMICILPFEQKFYAQNNVVVHYVGHPLLQVIKNFKPSSSFKKNHHIDKKKVLAILPGSRKQEINKMLGEYITAALSFQNEYHLVLAAAPNIEKEYYTNLIGSNMDNITIVENESYDLLSVADLAIVTSGTATLETALFKVPQVVCYKTSSINYAIGKRLIDIKYISLVNLILNQNLVPELIQHEADHTTIIDTLSKLDTGKMKAGYGLLEDLLTLETDASQMAAQIICS